MFADIGETQITPQYIQRESVYIHSICCCCERFSSAVIYEIQIPEYFICSH